MSAKSSAKARRTAARLAAVQSLYQQELGDASAHSSVFDLLNMRQAEFAEALVEPDQELLKSIAEGVVGRLGQIDGLLQAALSDSRPLERAEPVLRAILRAGVYELLSGGETPAGVIINDYVNVAHAFFEESEPKKVNAVLDAVARQLDRKAS